MYNRTIKINEDPPKYNKIGVTISRYTSTF